VARDADDTRRRILAAATEEFSQHGIAGARVDRIAAAANSNKAMLYAYFGNKKQLFDAVFAAMVTAATDAIPFDASDLPGYAAAMFERYRKDGHMARLSDWYRLEHGKPGPQDAAWAAQRGRLAAIAKAQQDKVVSDRLKPQELLAVITALARMGAREFTYLNPPSSIAAARAAVHDIVEQLAQPDDVRRQPLTG
jgi:AcrR family transcriptional regulator